MSSRKEPKTCEAIEDIYFEKGFGENYGFWLKIGGLYIDKYTRLLTIVSFIISAIYMWFSLILSAKNIITMDFTLAAENIHFVIFITAELTGVVTFLKQHKTVFYAYREIGKGFYDYENTLNEECLKEISTVHLDGKKKKCILHHFFASIVYFACFCITFVRPLLTYFMNDSGSPDDGIFRESAVAFWSPFDKTTWYFRLFTHIAILIISLVTGPMVCGCTFFIIFTCEALVSQLRILGYTFKYVVERASALDMPIEDAIKLCLKHSVRHHQLLYKYKDNIEKMISTFGFVLFLSFALMMCMSSFIFVMDDVSYISKVVFGLFLICEATMCFVICYYGELIQNLSEQISDRIYESDWTPYSKLMKPYLIIVSCRSRLKMKIELVGLMDLSHATFTSICKSSYSYLNLMLTT